MPGGDRSGAIGSCRRRDFAPAYSHSPQTDAGFCGCSCVFGDPLIELAVAGCGDDVGDGNDGRPELALVGHMPIVGRISFRLFGEPCRARRQGRRPPERDWRRRFPRRPRSSAAAPSGRSRQVAVGEVCARRGRTAAVVPGQSLSSSRRRSRPGESDQATKWRRSSAGRKMPSVLWLVVMMTPQTLGTRYSLRCFSSTRSTSGGAAMIGLHVVIERVAVELAEVACLVDAQDHRLSRSR